MTTVLFSANRNRHNRWDSLLEDDVP